MPTQFSAALPLAALATATAVASVHADSRAPAASDTNSEIHRPAATVGPIRFVPGTVDADVGAALGTGLGWAGYDGATRTPVVGAMADVRLGARFVIGAGATYEVWNGPWTMDDEVALATWDNLLVANAGSRRWRPAIGNSDAHSVPQVIGLPQSVVLADRLERGALLSGIKRGHLWVAESRDVNLSFDVAAAGRTAGIGDRLPVGDAELVTVTLNVTGAPGAIVRLFTDEGLILQTTLPTDGPGTDRCSGRAATTSRCRAAPVSARYDLVRRRYAADTLPSLVDALPA